MEDNILIGVIEKTSSKVMNGKEKYGLKLGGKWFNGFGKVPAKEGDTIEFEYEEAKVEDKTYYNIKVIRDVKNTAEPTYTRDDAIGESAQKKRASEMMRCAVDICIARHTYTIEEILTQFRWFMKQIGEDESILQSEKLPASH